MNNAAAMTYAKLSGAKIKIVFNYNNTIDHAVKM